MVGLADEESDVCDDEDDDDDVSTVVLSAFEEGGEALGVAVFLFSLVVEVGPLVVPGVLVSDSMVGVDEGVLVRVTVGFIVVEVEIG